VTKYFELKNILWSRTDPSEINLLKASTFVLTTTRSVLACTIVSPSESRSESELLVQDFKSYPTEFPFRDPSSMLQCTIVILKDLTKIHIDDTHDDKLRLVDEQIALHTHTRAQTRTRAADTATVIIMTTSSDDQTENDRSTIYRRNRPNAAARLRYYHPRIVLYADLANHSYRFFLWPGAKHFFFGSRHCVAVFFSQVHEKCTDLDLSLLYILKTGTYSKYSTFARENQFLAHCICFPQPCSSAGHRFESRVFIENR